MQVSKSVKDRLIDALVTAFVFAAAISWRETILKVLNVYFPWDDNSVWSEVIVTLIITVIVFTLIYVLIKGDTVVNQKVFNKK